MANNTRRLTNRQLTQAALFIALMAIGANLTSFITIGSVPLTFQTAVAILAGIILGRKVGTFAMIGYLIIGLIGAPVFSGFHGGLQSVALPTFGFLLSFIPTAYFVGLTYEKMNNQSFYTFMFASFIGLLINYAIGIIYLYFYSIYALEVAEPSFIAITLSMIPFFN